MVQPSTSQANQDMTTRLKIRIRELGILHEIAQAVTSTLNLQSVLNRIVEAAVYLTNAEEGFIMLVDPESEQLNLRAGKGLGDKAAKVMSMAVQDSLAGEVVSSGKPLRMGGRQKSDSYKVKTGYLVKSILNVPIKGQDRVLGVLSVDHAIESLKTFSDHDVSLLTNLAGYAAISIENARRYEEAATRADELAKSLEAYGTAPQIPTRESDQQALEKFNKGLKKQRDQVADAQELITNLSRELHSKAKSVEEVAHRLGVWNEEVQNLLPQLDWIAQTALAKGGTAPLGQLPSPDTELIITLEAILNSATDGILLCDAKGTILNANTAAQTMLYMLPEQLTGKLLSELAASDTHWDHLVSSMRLALALGGKKASSPPPSSATLYLGTEIVKATLVPTGINKKHSVAVVVILERITAETEGWQARDEALNALSEALRTPMAAISSYTDLMVSESVGLITRDQRRYLQRVRQSVDKMEKYLVESISKPRYLPPAEADHFNVSEKLTEAVNTAKEELRSAGIMLVATIPPSLPAIRAGSDYFTKIIIDLLLRAGTHINLKEIIELTTSVKEENGHPAYLIIAVKNQNSNPKAKESLDNDSDLRTIAKAVEYQGGRVWTDIDYQGRWVISFLIPTAI